MADIFEVIHTWQALGKPATGHDAAEISVVLAPGQTADAARNRLKTLLPSGLPFSFESAFSGADARSATGDRFYVLAFDTLPARGAETQGFVLARLLAEQVPFASARPVLVDSLIGGAAVAPAASVGLFGGLCNSNDAGPQEFGWAPRGLGILEAWKLSKGKGVTVASIDTGISDHVELQGVLTTSKPHLDLIEGGNDAHDRFSGDALIPNPGHGTLVSSVVASRGGLNADASTTPPGRITGTAPEAEILPIRTVKSVVYLRQSLLPKAFEHVLATNCDVVVMALGSPFPLESVEAGLQMLARAGVVTVCAAGNCWGPVVYPAAFAEKNLVTAVAAVDFAYRPWEFTSKGPQVVVSAFGEAVWGAQKNSAGAPDDTVHPSQGTTLATSLTAGIAATWVGHHGRAKLKAAADAAGTTVQVLFNTLLRSTAFRPAGWQSGMGAGVVNAGALLNAALPTAADVLPAMPGLAAPEGAGAVTPLRYAVAALARELDPLAEAEAAAVAEPLAAEALWRLYTASAGRRLTGFSAARGLSAPAGLTADTTQVSAELSAGLQGRPRLAALMGVAATPALAPAFIAPASIAPIASPAAAPRHPGFKPISVNGVNHAFGPGQKRLRSLSRAAAAPFDFAEAARRPLGGGLKATLKSLAAGDQPSLSGIAPLDEADSPPPRMSDEAAGRLHLQTYLEDAGNEWMADLAAPGRPQAVPDMALRGIAPVPGIATNTVTFQQTSDNIPIFGARLTLDLDHDTQSLVAINGKVISRPGGDISRVPTVSAADALARIAALCGQTAVAGNVPPELTWYFDEAAGQWHLTYRFRALPVRPLLPSDDHDDHPRDGIGCGSHLPLPPSFDYFVDVHTGDVVFYFSTTAHADGARPIPARMRGQDCRGDTPEIFGLTDARGYYVLVDSQRNIETYDYSHCDLSQVPQPPLPASPVSSATFDMGRASPAAVSAHYHARLVFDFYNNVLQRDGIDDKGMKIVSVINAYCPSNDPYPQWRNAVWYQNRMWYGQDANGDSYARFLEVIAHELTHGVTETSSKLVYRDQSGALNESFSDIFGVMIANWYRNGPKGPCPPVATWDWKIGNGLHSNGGPLRDLSDPASTGDPVHMSQLYTGARDNGGVHTNSNIHNFAIHKLLVDRDVNGNPVFETETLALLLYLTLTRLTPTSDFLDSRRTLENVVGVYYKNDPSLGDKLQAVANAFDAVGITPGMAVAVPAPPPAAPQPPPGAM